MNIRVLGSSGSEIPSHNLPAFLIDEFLLLDAGTISRKLGQKEQCKISHILLSHAHLDHIKGIPFLVDNMAASNNGCHVTVASGKDVISILQENIFNDKIWPDFTVIPDPANPVMQYQHVFPTAVLEIADYRISATRVSHSVPAYGYMIEDARESCLVYTGDTGPTEELWQRMNGCKVDALIIEVSFPDELTEVALASGHLTPSLLQAELQKIKILPKLIYISHIKPIYRKIIERQLADVHGVALQILEDGMVISI
jgi:ribonuclease BN (tRNA processing enzyme)